VRSEEKKQKNKDEEGEERDWKSSRDSATIME